LAARLDPAAERCQQRRHQRQRGAHREQHRQRAGDRGPVEERDAEQHHAEHRDHDDHAREQHGAADVSIATERRVAHLAPGAALQAGSG
jgi:hypothetical protein